LNALAKQFGRNDQVVLSVLALVAGVLAGLAAIAFRLAIHYIEIIAFQTGAVPLVDHAKSLAWWHILLVPSLGGLVIGLFIWYFMPNRRPQGVADVIESAAISDSRVSIIDGIKAALVSAASIGVGASVGREGPVVHLGASLGSWIARRLHLGRALSRTLLGCGVAAAVAASFNAPIAGTFFALEVVVGHYALSAFAPIVIASVTGTIVSRIYYGDFPAFILPDVWEITSFWEFPAFALLGLTSALVAIVLIRSIGFTSWLFEKFTIPTWVRPALAGFAVGVIGLSFPEVFGVGYEATDAALSSSFPLWLLIVLIICKTAATAISLGGGFGGGIFSPSLFLGAMLGGAFGIVATTAFPHLSSGHGAYSIIGMSAVAGAVLGAPISTILMIFELTSDYSLTIGVMIATAIATVVTQQTIGHSFFTWQLAQRGVNVRGGREISLLRAIRAEDVMETDFATVRPDCPVAMVRYKLQEAPYGELFVTEEGTERLVGIITFSDLHEAAYDTSKDEELTAKDLARAHPTVLAMNDDLETAIKTYGASGEVILPVVADHEGLKMVGVAHEHEVMLTYHRALNEARGD
jgi:CIC family chloride channel protein